MQNLGLKTRWTFIAIGALVVLFGVADYNHLFDDYPTLSELTFPHMWVIGAVLIIVGHGFTKESDKPVNGGGSDVAPGMNERKKGLFGDGSFGGDSGSDGGGGGGGD
ncbi:MAG: hypothetical protein GY746_04455 [Gammaproteobacteria bacterium]|nr:hypothetical protein [Gammaproteobacteria bacterium]